MKTKKYTLIRVRNVGDNLHLDVREDKDCDPEEFLIPKTRYNGKELTKWRFRKPQVEISFFDDYVVSLSLKGQKLFEVPQEEYPEEIKKYLSKIKKAETEHAKFVEERDKETQEHLVKWMQEHKDKLESFYSKENARKLSVPLRAYLLSRMFFYRGYPDAKCRLGLMQKILEIADRVYHSRVNEKEFLGIARGQFTFLLIGNAYDHNLEQTIEHAKKTGDDANKLFSVYFDLEEEVDEHLPPLPKGYLRRYIIYVLQFVLQEFSNDYGSLDIEKRRYGTMENACKGIYKQLRLLSYTPMILPEPLSANDLDYFFATFSLS